MRRPAAITVCGLAWLLSCGPRHLTAAGEPTRLRCPASVEPGVTFGDEGPSREEMARSREPYFHVERDLHPDDRELLRRPDSVTLVRVEPQGWSGAGAFHGCQATKQVTTSAPHLFEWVNRSIETSDGSTLMCFTPHHGVSVHRGDTTLELLVCFLCRQMYVYGKHPRLVPISAASEEILEATFRDAGL